ncbi:MAG: hypothetical protein Q9217_002775 [Psora testacea]
MAPKKRPAKKSKDEPSAKRPPRAARLNDDPVWSTINKDSQLVNEDLHAKYSSHRTYENWTREDWEEMRAEGLPEDTPYNEDGYSVPMEYFKYDPDWRRLVREFQEDLGAGRYEPEWQKQAAQAMEERARGDFDKYKDDQFEQFWGQKQKTPWRDLAGESSNIKLEELVENGVIREGDVFSYSRVIGRGKDRILIEKDCRVAKTERNVLTMAIPPARLKYARHLTTPQRATARPTKANELQPRYASDDNTNGVVNDNLEILGGNLGNSTSEGDKVKPEQASAEGSSSGDNRNADPHVHTKEPETASFFNRSKEPPDKQNGSIIDLANINAMPLPPTCSNGAATPAKRSPQHSPPPSSKAPAEDVIHYRISTLNEFESRLIEIDGRVDPKNHRNANSWKAIRGKRNNQDLGSLFEMREEYFVWRSPKIVKTPQKTMSGREVTAKKRT